MAFTIEVFEEEDATGFRLYDLTDWLGGFNQALVTALSLTVEYLGVVYTYTTPTGLITDIGLAPGYNTLFGTALNSYYVITPDKLLNGTTPLNTAYFPDGYYEITLTCSYNIIVELVPRSDFSNQGFLAESYLMASKLPLLINMDDFDYEENRLQFLCIAMLRSATWSAELGREADFTTLTTKINEFLDARSINEIWST